MDETDLLDDYTQVGSTVNTSDQVEPGDGKQLIDLTEYYDDTRQNTTTVMVSGIEQLNAGVLSQRIAKLSGLPNPNDYEPGTTRFNARLGAEGFISKIADGFKKFIENIIKYIKMAINWCINLAKGLLGLRKSERITKEIASKIHVLEKEFGDVMVGFGFPDGEFDVVKYLDGLDPNEDKAGQITLLVSKLNKEKDHIDGLTEALPIINEVLVELNRLGSDYKRPMINLSKTINESHKRVVAKDARGEAPTAGNQSPEVIAILKDCAEVSAKLNLDKLQPKLNDLFTKLYGVSFDSENLKNSFKESVQNVNKELETQRVNLLRNDVPKTISKIRYLETRYLDVKNNEISLNGVDWKTLQQFVNESDANKITDISHYLRVLSPDGSVSKSDVQNVYLQLTKDVADFSNFCYLVSDQLNKIIKQIQGLIDWYNGTKMYYEGCILGDAMAMLTAINNGLAKGRDPVRNQYDNIVENVEMMTEAQARTFMEITGEVNKTMIDNDVAQLKTKYNKLSKQLGFRSK